MRWSVGRVVDMMELEWGDEDREAEHGRFHGLISGKSRKGMGKLPSHLSYLNKSEK